MADCDGPERQTQPEEDALRYDYSPELDLMFAVGTKEAFLTIDLRDISYVDLVHSLLFNGDVVLFQMEWVCLASIMIRRLGARGVPLCQRQLCQRCFRPAFHRRGCGHCSLCPSCGGVDRCVQCNAEQVSQDETDENLPEGWSLLADQQFVTFSEADAESLSKMMKLVRQGGLKEEKWSEVEEVLQHFNQQELIELFEINRTFTGIHLGEVPEEVLRSMLLSCLLARSEVKCQTCSLHGRPIPNIRTILHACIHSNFCYECVKANYCICKERYCVEHLSQGHTVVKHTIFNN
ncbi:uncharacterized protein LOC132203863 [Neocloeon triangulifer]|uniref:uncharacterized protein LOC132203863 n=1 Tax=Neocloeon triangulifer TaxID=2078957 RepID=UPI00286EE2E0|nr:uncharacterized protein LOC132203863 [Neocloeon triangulifer]